MRVLYEEEVQALLTDGGSGAVTCLLDLDLPRAGGGPRHGPGDPTLAGAATRQLAEVLLRHAEKRGAGRLDLALFGGEPLVEIERVVDISKALQRACSAAGMAYAAYVMTGGALLDAVGARRLAQAGVARVQVGLEVPRGTPRSRPGGAGASWSHVLDAVAQACSEARLVLRVTPDGCDLERLVDALEERGLATGEQALALYVARRAPTVQQARELVVVSALLEAPAPALLLQ